MELRDICFIFEILVSLLSTQPFFLAAKGTSAPKMLKFFKEAKDEAEKSDLKCLGVTTDMGSENLAIWALVGVYADRDSDNCLVPELAYDDLVFIFMPDPPHGLKNIKGSYGKSINTNFFNLFSAFYIGASIKYVIQMPRWFFEINGLEDLPPGTMVNVKYVITQLIKIQKEENLLLVPGLNYSHLYPNNWQKMRMEFTFMIISDKVVAAIHVCVEQGSS
jgi:hypothetical protein